MVFLWLIDGGWSGDPNYTKWDDPPSTIQVKEPHEPFCDALGWINDWSTYPPPRSPNPLRNKGLIKGLTIGFP